jgi:hypothetical protein
MPFMTVGMSLIWPICKGFKRPVLPNAHLCTGTETAL